MKGREPHREFFCGQENVFAEGWKGLRIRASGRGKIRREFRKVTKWFLVSYLLSMGLHGNSYRRLGRQERGFQIIFFQFFLEPFVLPIHTPSSLSILWQVI